MKKPDHEFYTINELVDRWKVYDNTLNEDDLLKYGVNGRLVFSIRVIPPEGVEYVQYQMFTKISDTDSKKNEWEECSTPKKAFHDKPLYPNVSIKTMNDVYDLENGQSLEPEFDPICDEFKNECKKQCHMTATLFFDSNGPYWSNGSEELWSLEVVQAGSDCPYERTIFNNRQHFEKINKRDLCVTLDEVRRFENEKFQDQFPQPAYLDPENEFFSRTLYAAVKTWEAIFIQKQHLDKNSAAEAGKTFLLSPQNEFLELFNDWVTKRIGGQEIKGMSDHLAKEIGKIAGGDYNRDRGKWTQFKRNHGEHS